ncbi:MAG TPA: polysaccharide deacetylase family protein [Bacillota bacterium]|nr:polysaccharide deacetylase family protein [Bacillota bacterium]
MRAAFGGGSLLLFIFLVVGIVFGFDISKHRINSAVVDKTETAVSETGEKKEAGAKPTDAIHYKDRVAVLTYHNIDEKESPYTISPELFHQHMQALKDNGYHVISVEDMIGFLQNKKPVPSNAVVITFDDGYKSVYTYAYPELVKQGFTATTFLIVHYQQSYNPSLPFLSWDQVKEMKKAGFSFYSHTYNLHDTMMGENGKMVQPLSNRILVNKRLETETEYENRVRNDLFQAYTILGQELGNKMDILCFPHGDYNQKVLDIGNKVGIHYFFSGYEGINTHSTGAVLKRINVGAPYVTADKVIQKLNYFENH